MNKKKKIFSDRRWNDKLGGIVIGETEITYEDEKRGLDAMLESKAITKEIYEKHLKEAKNKYGIKE